MRYTAIKYIIFAGIATGCNLLSQWLITNLLLLSDLGQEIIYWGALLIGTFIGFLTKYILDKNFIFYYKVTSARIEIYKFSLYSLMGIITTAIFWGIQSFFNYVLAFEGAKYIGGFIGLSIGYTSKYFLDKRFVFTRRK